MLELLNNYPEAGKVVKDHFLSRMLKNLNDDDIPDDFKEHVKNMGMEDDRLVKLVGEAPRALFDVFDNHHFFINVILNYEDKTFTWNINGEPSNKVYIFRKAAEQDAVAEAFKLLNEKLCQIKS